MRLPIPQEYWNATGDLLIELWRGTGEFADLDRGVGALVLSARHTMAPQEVADRGDREALIVTFQKSLNIYVKDQTLINEGSGESFQDGLSTRLLA